MTLKTLVADLSGVGPELGKKLHSLGITSVWDLIDYLPRRYNDFSHIEQIAHIRPGEVTVKAVIKQARGRYARRGMHVTEAAASDASGSVRLIWFNQPYRAASLKPNQEYFISGEFKFSHQRLSIMNPAIELASDLPLHTARIVPVYRETKGINSSQLRKLVMQTLPVIEDLEETLPLWLLDAEKLIPRGLAYKSLHFPSDSNHLAQARHRFAFEEVFTLTLAALMNKYEQESFAAPEIVFDEKLAKDFVKHLPFRLTDGQRAAVWQIYKDIAQQRPMNRLLEGDVGSGKTVVGTMAALMVMCRNLQVAFMAPTELLARQHAETVYELLRPLGMSDKVGLLIGSVGAAKKERIRKDVKEGRVGIIVGTHALIQEQVDMHNLGLVIIDEQHRFGVEQRKKLLQKAGHGVHVLTMTATPIPRSLALTLYGELETSILSTKPAGRLPVITKVVPLSSRTTLYKNIDQQLKNGRQMFVVCPVIYEQNMLKATSAEETYKVLSNGPFRHRRIGLLHGKMKADEKDRLMQQFVAGKLDILVSTTVIEVGVDVPNATVMLIESAERFGLAQLHQLRGRVGRSRHQGYCYAMMSESKEPPPRMRAFAQSDDGFKLAELDLELRGPGAIYGTEQHGPLDLRVARLTDIKLIHAARARAQEYIDRNEKLVQYKNLSKHVNSLRAVTNLN